MLGVGVFEELIVEKAGGFVVEFLEAGDFAAFFIGLGIVGFLDDGDTGAVGELLDGVDEGKVFILHEEGEGVTTFSAAEAFVVLPGGVDVEGGGFFSVEGAVNFEAGARTFDGEVGRNEIDNIRRGEDLFDRFWRNAAHGVIVNRMFGLRQLWVTLGP